MAYGGGAKKLGKILPNYMKLLILIVTYLGDRGYVWSILPAATTVRGTFVAFPVANALYHKGARLSMIMTYVTAASLVIAGRAKVGAVYCLSE